MLLKEDAKQPGNARELILLPLQQTGGLGDDNAKNIRGGLEGEKQIENWFILTSCAEEDDAARDQIQAGTSCL